MMPELREIESPAANPIDYAMQTVEQGRPVRRRRRFHFGSGAALILMVLIIISLLCFAALSMVSAQADTRLTDRYAEEVTGYYTARNAGEAYLARTDAELAELYSSCTQESANKEADIRQSDQNSQRTDSSSADASGGSGAVLRAYYEAARSLSSYVDPADTSSRWHDEIQNILANTGHNEEAENTPLLVFSASVSSTQDYLLVLLVREPDEDNSAHYEILSAKTVTTTDYDYDTTLDVLRRSQ